MFSNDFFWVRQTTSLARVYAYVHCARPSLPPCWARSSRQWAVTKVFANLLRWRFGERSPGTMYECSISRSPLGIDSRGCSREGYKEGTISQSGTFLLALDHLEFPPFGTVVLYSLPFVVMINNRSKSPAQLYAYWGRSGLTNTVTGHADYLMGGWETSAYHPVLSHSPHQHAHEITLLLPFAVCLW